MNHLLDKEDDHVVGSSFDRSFLSGGRASTTTTTTTAAPPRPRLQLPKEPKQLRACKRCRRILTEKQFMIEGCASCDPGVMEEPNRTSRRDMEAETTANFSGYMGIFDSKKSWVARLMGARKVHKGIYAFEINDNNSAEGGAGGSKLREVDEDEDGDYEADGDDILMKKKDKYDDNDDDLTYEGGLMEGLEGGGEGEDNGEGARKKSRTEGAGVDDRDSFFNTFATE